MEKIEDSIQLIQSSKELGNDSFDAIDEMKCNKDKIIQKQLDKDEKILYSACVHKFNHVSKKQERIILITNKKIYNISPPSLLKDMISIVSQKFRIRRVISIDQISSVTLSRMGFEFVIHVPLEYDYRYSSPKRELILRILMECYSRLTGKPHLIFYFKDELTLAHCTTTKFDVKKGIDKRPKENFHVLNIKDLEKSIFSQELDSSTLTVRSNNLINKEKNKDVTLDDFKVIKVVGRGAFGKVMMVEQKDTKQIFAMKSLRKEDIIEKNQLEHTKQERKILEDVNHPFLVNLVYGFQTNDKIFFVMQFKRGGELFQHLRNDKRFSEERSKFYAAEIILALEYLHSKDIIYRDLKPENVLLDEDGHIALTDFGLAKYLKQNQLTQTFVGTPEYLAPEVIQQKGYGKESDWWSFGILLFEMLVGQPPFYTENYNLMFRLIKEGDVRFPSQIQISPLAKDFITKCLIKNSNERLGSKNGAEEIKAHPWFKNIDWIGLLNKQVKPVFKPAVKGKYCVNNFDEEFTSEDPVHSFVATTQMKLVEQSQFQFNDFGYNYENQENY